MATRGTRVWKDGQAAEVEAAIEEYFDSLVKTRIIKRKVDGEWVQEEEEYMAPPTMAGLALALGVTRPTILNYAERDEFYPVITRAKLRLAEWWESALASGQASNGARFALEVNHRYGKEDQDEREGDGFTMQVLPPAPKEQIKAIPMWEPEE
jgi:hypothetical protein